MQFTPKSAEEIAEAGLLPDGEYDFEITGAAEKVSKAGNDMIELDVKVFDGEGGSRALRDYLLSNEKGMKKLRGFSVATGILDRYDAGDIDAWKLSGLTGRCKLRKDDGKDGYEPKNAVAYYIDPTKAERAPTPGFVRQQRQPAPARAPEVDDEIPF